jgi:hypothetical protein
LRSSARSNFEPSPRQLAPCMQASVAGFARASFSKSACWFFGPA